MWARRVVNVEGVLGLLGECSFRLERIVRAWPMRAGRVKGML